jgi:hypothetical protein
MEDGDLQKAMARYRENLEFSANLYQWLALAEVLLRNELVASITPEGVHEENFDPFLHIWQDLRQEERADYFKAAQR